ncbi:heavy-metal-associated domain-containing protein [Chryseobacterium sp. SNU WT5]|uniref:heavy-metal-associated domain-containing protein n=1 Tax=Chryseobacterium sp. SNU WT5 TaxID=2594269 RepID=UPI0011814242|nr:heavy metal-associated domain-containing protein [Chryseobacterium sp. SNU WT5]QDP84964.1 heavy-metal-associated domain-containing protein [Chryseobacterium sp. SNU WT5]
MNQVVEINGMSCGGCIKSVEKALKTIEGVETVNVTLNPPVANLETNHSISDADLKHALSKEGHYSIAGSSEGDGAPKKSGGCGCG